MDQAERVEEGLRSRALYERALRVIPGGVNSPVRAYAPFPFFAKSARGSRILSVDGVKYLDYCMGYGTMILGHSYPPLLDVRNLVGSGVLYGVPIENEVELAEMVRKIVPSIEMSRLTSTGAEATMHAIRLARGYTGRTLVVKFDGCYHGAHDSLMVKMESSKSAPMSLGIPKAVVNNVIVIPYNDVQSIDNLFLTRGEQIAAVIVEPVMGNAGLILPRPGFLEKLRSVTKANGSLLIFDEVITGFRLALGGAQEYYGITADLVTYAKAMGGGLPIGLFGGRADIMSMLSPLGRVYQAGTFSGNPLSVGASMITLRELVKNGRGFYDDLRSKQEVITDHLIDVIGNQGLPASVNRIGSMFQVFFTQKIISNHADAKTSNPSKFDTFFTDLLKNAVFVPPSQFETCFLSSAHDESDVQTTADVMANALRKALLP